MRFVCIDLETTGLNRRGNVSNGHRVIEVACVEVIDGVITGREYHEYVDPCQKIDVGATKVHGVQDVFLQGKPLFIEIKDKLLHFIGDSILVIHNALFDTAFLDKEFLLLPQSQRPVRVFRVIDTLQITRDLFPGMKNDLNTLCHRYHIPPRIGVHNALEDARILALLFIKLYYGT